MAGYIYGESLEGTGLLYVTDVSLVVDASLLLLGAYFVQHGAPLPAVPPRFNELRTRPNPLHGRTHPNVTSAQVKYVDVAFAGTVHEYLPPPLTIKVHPTEASLLL